ncbi:MAG TPA: hypothetical protein VNQ79_03425 [Blastocatellia bacterium]|nr:hypothetical protein [Blastocatellia bacterium]
MEFRLQPGFAIDSGQSPAEAGTPNTVSAACALARQVREKYPLQRADEIARALGVEIITDEWSVANGRVVYFAECRLRPPQIRLNLAAIRIAAQNAQADSAIAAWFSERRIAEIVTAHELYHILARQASSQGTEASAHAFARELLHLPFSPQLCERLLMA